MSIASISKINTCHSKQNGILIKFKEKKHWLIQTHLKLQLEVKNKNKKREKSELEQAKTMLDSYLRQYISK